MEDHIQQRLDAMDQQALIGEKGYQIFSRMYALTNPKPDSAPYQKHNNWTRYAIGGVMVASSIVSANHTIPTFAGDDKQGIALLFGIVAGVAAFFMSEMALATFAYYGVLRHYRAHQTEPKSIQWLVGGGVFIPLIVMASANIFHEFKSNGLSIAPLIETVITLAISLSAPIMGYISGEIFAALEVNDRIDNAKYLFDQKQEQEKWEEKCRAAWGRSKGNYGGNIRVEPLPNSIPQLSIGMNGMENAGNQQFLPSKSSIGHTKKPMASQIVKEFFENNPDALSRDPIEISQELGVGKSTVYNVIKEMRG